MDYFPTIAVGYVKRGVCLRFVLLLTVRSRYIVSVRRSHSRCNEKTEQNELPARR